MCWGWGSLGPASGVSDIPAPIASWEWGVGLRAEGALDPLTPRNTLVKSSVDSAAPVRTGTRVPSSILAAAKHGVLGLIPLPTQAPPPPYG